MNVLIFLKVSVGVMQKSYGGKYNCVFRDRVWEDPHCCASYVWDGSFDSETAEEHMCLSCPYCGFSPSGELLYILLRSMLLLYKSIFLGSTIFFFSGQIRNIMEQISFSSLLFLGALYFGHFRLGNFVLQVYSL